MAGTAAGVEGLQISKLFRPTIKSSRCRYPAFVTRIVLHLHKAQILQRHTGPINSRNGRLPAQFLFAAGVLEIGVAEPSCRPPGSQGIVEQKADHVGLSEKLGDGRQFPCANLDLGGVDFVFFLGLPELIDPTEAVGGGEHLQRKIRHQTLQLLLVFWRQGELKDRRIEPEDLRQHASGETGGQLPTVGRAFIGGEVFTLFQSDRHRIVRVGIHQQIVLGQEASE